MVAALLLTQQACSSTTSDVAAPASTTAQAPASARTPDPAVTSTRPAAPVEPATPRPRASSTTPAASAGGSSGDILNGTRQVVIRPLPNSGAIVALTGEGRLTTTDGDAATTLFVLTPTGGRHLIRTATAGAGGEASCLAITTDGSNPLTIRATACDAGDSRQLFSIQRQPKKDTAGRSTYTINSGGAYLQVSADNGLIAEELGDGSVRTTFSFVDNGKATLPKIGD